MQKQELLNHLLQTNLLSLAFIGDAVHTLYVRQQILAMDLNKMQNYHTIAARYCKASHQAQTLKAIEPLLTEAEQEIVRRARNAKPKHQAKNSNAEEYRLSTMFEALIGYLYLSEETARLETFLKISVQ